MQIEFFFSDPQKNFVWCLYLFCHMSTLVGLIFQNSTNTYSPKKTWLCRLLHWNHACIWVLSYHSYVMKRYFPALSYSVITTSLILPNCSPASVNILPPFPVAAFPFQVMPQPPSSLQVLLFGFGFASSFLEVSQNILPMMDVLRFTGEAFLPVLLCPEKNTSLSCLQLSSVCSTSCNLEESSGYWPLT